MNVETANAIQVGHNGLAGQTAFVTGAAQGLGATFAKALYSCGCNVVLADIDAERNAATLASFCADERAHALRLDVSDGKAAATAFDAAVERYGAVDILVNNAAVTRPTSLWDISVAEWDLVMAVNLRGVFLMSRAAAAHMRQRGYGRIVNMASLAAQMARPSGVHYAASKAGIVALTRIFATELASDGITVNAIAPAIVDTPMLATVGARRVEALAAEVPIGRICDPSEVAALLIFLVSRQTGYITGATYDINGGVLMR